MNPFIIIIIFLLSSCSLFEETTTIQIDKPKIFAFAQTSPITQIDFWKKIPTRQIQILDSTDSNFKNFEEFKNEWIKFQDLRSHSVQKIDKKISKQQIRKAVAIFPVPLLKFLNKNIHAFVLVSNLGVSQFIHKANDGKYIVFLDQNINSIGLNDWYLAREKSALNDLENSTIKMQSLLSHENTTEDTLLFVIAQSISLILSDNEAIFSLNKESPNSFLANSWQIKDEVIISKWSKYFSEIGFVSYYGQTMKRINFDKSYEFYQLLEKTDFINLYSTSSPLRDFVETTTIYIYNILLVRPFHLEFFEEEVMLDSFSSCLKNARCLNKRLYLDSIFSSLK